MLLSNSKLAEALPLLKKLAEHQYEAVFVGGCVRDIVAGRQIKDVDIATSASPEQVMQLFEHTVPTGIKHGTITVVLSEGLSFEVTTYRTESEYEAYRRPVEVTFVLELNEDLRRRDFTINAMAIDLNGQLIDPFGGQTDLQHGRIRLVGDEAARFQEDALRMLRCIRFAAEFGVTETPVEAGTWAALMLHRGLLRHIAMERVGAELHKLICGARPELGLKLLQRSGLLSFTKEPLPELSWEHVDRAIEAKPISQLDVPHRRFAAFALLFGLDLSATKRWFKTLRFSGSMTDEIAAIVELNSYWVDKRMYELACEHERRTMEWTRLILAYSKATCLDWLLIQRQLLPASNATMLGLLELQLQQQELLSLKQLAVKGTDLIKYLDKPSGPWIQKRLQRLLLEAALGEVDNEKQALLARAQALEGEVELH